MEVVKPVCQIFNNHHRRQRKNHATIRTMPNLDIIFLNDMKLGCVNRIHGKVALDLHPGTKSNSFLQFILISLKDIGSSLH